MDVDNAFISDMVEKFYERVRLDGELGPIFDAAISDWDAHLDQMKRFWRSVIFKTGEFHGNPMQKHQQLPHLDQQLFHRWLHLFNFTLSQLGNEDARLEIGAKARAIAGSLLNGFLWSRQGGRADGFGFQHVKIADA